MHCPYCSAPTRVVDSRLNEPADAVRRRRRCAACAARFTTYERAEAPALIVHKRDGQREPFDRQKLLGGLLRAATKRPLKVADLEAAVDAIAAEVRRGGGAAAAEQIGELALRALNALDRVAAIRFASVYRNFEDLSQFEAELRRLEAEPAATAAIPRPDAPGPTMALPSARSESIEVSAAGRARGKDRASESTRRRHVEHA